MATFSLSLLPKTLTHHSRPKAPAPTYSSHQLQSLTTFNLSSSSPWTRLHSNTARTTQFRPVVLAAVDGDSSSRETILLPGCDYNHWLIVMEFPKDPAPTREQMIDTYLETLATVLGSMEEAKKNMYAFSTTTYTGFQCTVDEATSEKFKGLPGVLWVLPDSYIDVKNKDYGGDKYVNGEIIPCKYPTYQPNQRNSSKSEGRRYERRRDGPAANRKWTRQGTTTSESSPTSG